jgi:hypothetical protein
MNRDDPAAILVVGSVAFDTVRTPFGEATEVLGGSATHFAVAASFLAPVRLVAVVGEDFTDEHLRPMRERGVDLRGLARTTSTTRGPSTPSSTSSPRSIRPFPKSGSRHPSSSSRTSIRICRLVFSTGSTRPG